MSTPIFKRILVNEKLELLKFKTQILELFEKSFGKKLDEKLWYWAYIDNPNGNPIVSLYFDKQKLIGHYASIPIKFMYKHKNIDAILSITSMVDISYTRYGIFAQQGNQVYEKAIELGYKFVCGFPNKLAAPGRKKRLGWTLEEDIYVANFSYEELQKLNNRNYSDMITFNIEDRENLEWRLSKPGEKYFKIGQNILKQYEDSFDIVFMSNDLSNLESGRRYNLLLDCDLDKHLDKKLFNYTFGYRLFDTSLSGIEFKKDLIISDVF